ncbi:MAG: sulfate adenylyltransferase subunit CysN [Acidobacteria bacterium]|nr:MAG: sulfate adenylyltransferase subunit CysN [Acidobacteriota bacterium]
MLSALDTGFEDGFHSFLDRDINKELLRFTTAGSVDDGKSTLIGRLLHDSKAVYEDQLASVKKSKINRSGGPIDFSLLTDGLRAEREQGITIDVAYRYFSTSRRKFIIADTPGHEEYTRNMATGASTADLAVILVDATKGLLAQTRRHTHIASLLGIPNLLVAINKLDLVDCREDVFLRLQEDFLALAERLEFPAAKCIPISALGGDNVAVRSDRMPWYSGPTLLEHLETVEIRPTVDVAGLRFPIQYVIRPDASFRGFAGQVAGGILRPGDPVLALPSRQKTRVQSIVTYDGELSEAGSSMSVTVKLEDEIDLSRGDMLVSPSAPPQVSRRFEAMVVWLHPRPLELNRAYLVKHTGRQVKAKATEIRYRVDVNTLAHAPTHQLEMNGIAAVEFETNESLFFDSYRRNRTTGSFILIDPIANATVGAAMIYEARQQSLGAVESEGTARVKTDQGTVTLQERQQRHGYRPAILLVEGRGALVKQLERSLFERGFEVLVLEGDTLSSEALPLLLKSLWSAGLLVISSSTAIAQANREAIKALAADCAFDLAALQLPTDDREAVRQVLALTESLHTEIRSKDQITVN